MYGSRSLPTVLFCMAAAHHVLASSNSTSYGQPIIVDTDIMSDVDDVGALAIANVLHNCGMADFRGVAIDTHSQYGALAASVINTYFDNGDVPIAAIRPLTNETFSSKTEGEYATKLAFGDWPRALNDTATTPTPVELYRSVLASAADSSINIVSVGFLTNIADFLRSPADKVSPLAGPELASAKVKELIIMGGRYPAGYEFNFGFDRNSTQYVLENWPTSVPVTFSGYELGKKIYSGHHLREHSHPNSPILAAYEWYVAGNSTIRESWDPLTTLFGILGLDGFAQLGLESPFVFANEFGYNTFNTSSGTNTWVNDSSVTNQHWLKLADGVSNSSVAWMLDQFYTHDPLVQTCFGYDAMLTAQ